MKLHTMNALSYPKAALDDKLLYSVYLELELHRLVCHLHALGVRVILEGKQPWNCLGKLSAKRADNYNVSGNLINYCVHA